jgi:hypothetical protein
MGDVTPTLHLPAVAQVIPNITSLNTVFLWRDKNSALWKTSREQTDLYDTEQHASIENMPKSSS